MDRRQIVLGMVAAALCVSRASAQSYPARPVRLLVGFAAGGLLDLMIRAVSEPLRKELGAPVVVENKPGGTGTVAAASLKQAGADGYTLMHAESSVLYINEHVGQFGYDPARDFSYISTIGRSSFALVVNAKVPVNSYEEFVAQAKANPGKMHYGTPGASSPHRIAMEIFQQITGVSLAHVPYRGGAPALTDLRSGQIESMLTDLSVALPYVREGTLKALCVCTPNRLAVAPAVPTFAEVGIGDVPAFVLHGIVGPAGLPADLAVRLNAAVHAAVQSADLARFVETGFVPALTTPRQFENLVAAERNRVRDLVRKLGITTG